MPRKDKKIHNFSPPERTQYRFPDPLDQKRYEEFIAGEGNRHFGRDVALVAVSIEKAAAQGNWVEMGKLTTQMQHLVKAQARMQLELGELVPINELVGELNRAWGAILHDRITAFLNGGEPLPQPDSFGGPHHPWFDMYDEMILEVAERTQEVVKQFADGKSAPRSAGRKRGE